MAKSSLVDKLKALRMRCDRAIDGDGIIMLDEAITQAEIYYSKLLDYRIQARAAMKAQSLGLCKAVIKHAILDDEKQDKEARRRETIELKGVE